MITPKPITKALYVVVGKVGAEIMSIEVRASGKFDAKVAFVSQFDSAIAYIEDVYGPYERIEE